ncbi:AMP-binding protein [Actinomyces sp. F1_1611]
MTLTEKLRKNYAPGVPFEIGIPDTRLHDYLLGAASRYPQRVALDFMSKQTTYRQLEDQVRRAATVLAGAGVKPGDRVALVLPNCPQHIVAIFATSLLGAIIVEHNPLAPEEELRSEFERHGATVVVAWENSVDKLGFLGPAATVFGVNLADDIPRTSRVLLKLPLPSIRAKRDLLGAKTPGYVRPWAATVAKAQPRPGTGPAHPDDTALLIHTGGTTGVPKAVALTHRNICVNAVQDVAWVPPLHEGAEVFYAVLPFFHAYGFGISLMAAVRLGATIAVFPKFDPVQICLSQRRLPCTFFIGVPPIYERLLKSARELEISLESITYAISGAMALDPKLAAEWEAATGGYLVEGYGMSEASPTLLGSPLSPKRRPSTLGIPYPSTEVRIVDPEQTEVDVADGEVGELIVRGPQVFNGYWNDPEETATVLKDGWLHTGDLVKVVDGFIVMADRRKELIISGGFNIYPSQVEEAVRSMPGISDVAVVGMPGGTRGEDVVAALVLEAGASLTLADVRQWAEKSLAHYALPRQIVVLQELPKSQIGKVMRKRVREQLAELQSGITDVQAGLGERLSNLATQVSEMAEHASAAVSHTLRKDKEPASAPEVPEEDPVPDAAENPEESA